MIGVNLLILRNQNRWCNGLRAFGRAGVCCSGVSRKAAETLFEGLLEHFCVGEVADSTWSTGRRDSEVCGMGLVVGLAGAKTGVDGAI
jgi:hypothetical protein